MKPPSSYLISLDPDFVHSATGEESMELDIDAIRKLKAQLESKEIVSGTVAHLSTDCPLHYALTFLQLGARLTFRLPNGKTDKTYNLILEEVCESSTE
jgi:hypothetical protein